MLELPKYEPLTTESRVKDFQIPEFLFINKELVKLPQTLRRKDVHFLLDEAGRPVRAAWIPRSLAFYLNSVRFAGSYVERTELEKAIDAVDDVISSLVKDKLLKGKTRAGAMSFAQANEAVPEDSILLTERTFYKLADSNPRWLKAKTVVAVRFPNLGPNTTRELKVIVQGESTSYSANSLGSLLPQLKDLLDEIEDDEPEELLVDSFYLNPKTLKESFEGDCDGDQIFIAIEKKGKPKFANLDLTRAPKGIPQKDIDLLFHKANRVDRTSLATWLGPYFDNVPIGPATYAIRWQLNKLCKEYSHKPNPMYWAWKELAPWAINLIEFVMDIRKGEWTQDQINEKMRLIDSIMEEIKVAQKAGDWFARTVTSRNIIKPGEFIQRFRTLQEYMDYITNQKTLGDLLQCQNP